MAGPAAADERGVERHRYDPDVARSRRRTFRRLTILSSVVGALLTLRNKKLAENQRRFDLP